MYLSMPVALKRLILLSVFTVTLFAVSGCGNDSSVEPILTETPSNTLQATPDLSLEPTPSRTAEVLRLTVNELKERIDRGESLFLIDASSQARWENSSVKLPGALHILPGTMKEHLGEIPHDKTVVVYAPCSCPSDDQAAVQEAKDLLGRGWTSVYALAGGLNDWRVAGFSTEPK